MGAKVSAEMLAALVLIKQKGKTASEAARLVGISKSAISMNSEYRAFKDKLRSKAK